MLPKAPRGTYWVPIGDGGVLAGPHPVVADEGLEARITRLREQARITHFVDLSEVGEWMPSYDSLLGQSDDYVRYPIRDRRLPEDTERLHEILATAIGAARRGETTYIHCQAGLGRTGTVVGCLLRELGFGGDEALQELVRLRWESRLHEGSPEFEEQREFIREWKPR